MKLFAREPLTVVFVLVVSLIVLNIPDGVFGNEATPGFHEGLGAIDVAANTHSSTGLACDRCGCSASPQRSTADRPRLDPESLMTSATSFAVTRRRAAELASDPVPVLGRRNVRPRFDSVSPAGSSTASGRAGL